MLTIYKHAPLILELYQRVARAELPDQVREILAKKGLKISRSYIYRVLSNPVYMGKIRIPAFEAEVERTIDGLHQGIVDEELYWKVQSALYKKAKPRQLKTNKTFREELRFRGLLKCSKCNSKLTGSLSRSRTGKRHAYYHCNHCHQERLNASQVHKRISDLLEGINFNKEVQELYHLILTKLERGNQSEIKQDKKRLQKDFAEQNQRIQKIQDLLVDGNLDVNEYQELKLRYSQKRDEIQENLNEFKAQNSTSKGNLKEGISLLTNLSKFFLSADPITQRKIVGSIFPENIEILENKCRTPRINEVLRLILAVNSGSRASKKGHEVPNLILSQEVESGRFELPSKQGPGEFSTSLSLN